MTLTLSNWMTWQAYQDVDVTSIFYNINCFIFFAMDDINYFKQFIKFDFFIKKSNIKSDFFMKSDKKRF